MIDQCRTCSLKGNLKECMQTDCSLHDNWFALVQAKKIEALSSNFPEKCLCGDPSRYLLKINNKGYHSCNKYGPCPSYKELSKENSELKARMASLRESLRLISNVNMMDYEYQRLARKTLELTK